MNRAVILFGHPEKESFNARLAAAYEDAYRSAGGEVLRIDLIDLQFDPILRSGYRSPQQLEPDLQRAKHAIEAANHLVWIFPTYWASPPALVRGFVDRLFLPQWAFRYEKGKPLPVGLLRGRSSRVLFTMDSPSFWYSLVNHRCLHRSFGTATLKFCGLGPVNIRAVHNVHHMSEAKRAGWLERAAEMAARDALRPRSKAMLLNTASLRPRASESSPHATGSSANTSTSTPSL